MAGAITVEEVAGAKALMRFAELPEALHGTEPCFAPMVMAWERYRLDVRRNPFFERGDAVYLLARRLGRPAGRLAAHLSAPGAEGRIGFWWADDDQAVANALVAAAQAWLAERGCTSMTGPLSFTSVEEVGLLAVGYDAPGLTGRPWHPPHLTDLLEETGFEVVDEHPTWRLPATYGAVSRPLDDDLPDQAGAYIDRRIVLQGIAAVPDVAEALRHAGVRSAWALARRAKAAEWETCTVVRCTADPAAAVPALQAVAGRAGYRWVVAPWTPNRRADPEAVHRTYRRRW